MQQPEIDYTRITTDPVWKEEIVPMLEYLRFQALEALAESGEDEHRIKAQTYKALVELPEQELEIRRMEREQREQELREEESRQNVRRTRTGILYRVQRAIGR